MSSTPKFTLDVEVMASTLATSIENTMVSLYDLQTSLINAHGDNTTPGPHQLISKMRRKLKMLWESIRAFLQKAHSFGGDVIMLQESLEKESADDCMEFLVEMKTISTQLLEWAKVLTDQCMNFGKEFSSLAPMFEKTLRQVKARVDNVHFGEYELDRATVEAYLAASGEPHQEYPASWIERPIVVEPSTVDKATQAFVKDNIAATRPNGLKSLDMAISALIDMNSKLAQFVQYWEETNKSCQRYILNGMVNPAEALTFATKWRANRKALESAILVIAKSCDAVLVEAIGAPPPRPPTPPQRGGALLTTGHGRRSSIDQKALPPPLPPRPASKHGGGSCMGFFMCG